MNSIEKQAYDLVNKVLTQMAEVRENVEQEMINKGLDPNEWTIVDNFGEVLDNPNTPYWCKAEKRSY